MLTCGASSANYDVAPGVAAALRNFRLPETLGFRQVPAPVMFCADWAEGAWSRRLGGRAIGTADGRLLTICSRRMPRC
jgi:hypothetical protein